MIEEWSWRWWALCMAACAAVSMALAFPMIRLFELLHIYRDNVRGIT